MDKILKFKQWLDRNPRTLSKTILNFDKLYRNEPCYCGSSIKFKKCCGVDENIKNRYIKNKYKESIKNRKQKTE